MKMDWLEAIAGYIFVGIVLAWGLFRLFVWWLSRQWQSEARKAIEAARSLDPFAQIRIARCVLEAMTIVERAREADGPPGSIIAAATEVAARATKARHAALAAGAARRTDPDWNAASLVESWAVSLCGSFNGRLSKEAYNKVDKMVFAFVADVLGPMELANAVETTSPGWQKLPREWKPTKLL